MESKFYKGQHVVAIDNFEYGEKGEVFVVVDPDDPYRKDWQVVVKKPNSSGHNVAEHRAVFEPATNQPRFTRGDKVRAIDTDNDSGLIDGKVYTIRHGDNPEQEDYYVVIEELDDYADYNPHRALLVLVDDEE